MSGTGPLAATMSVSSRLREYKKRIEELERELAVAQERLAELERAIRKHRSDVGDEITEADASLYHIVDR